MRKHAEVNAKLVMHVQRRHITVHVFRHHYTWQLLLPAGHFSIVTTATNSSLALVQEQQKYAVMPILNHAPIEQAVQHGP